MTCRSEKGFIAYILGLSHRLVTEIPDVVLVLLTSFMAHSLAAQEDMLNKQFQDLARSDIVGSSYVAARDAFTAQEGVKEFLREKTAREEDVVLGALARVLLGRTEVATAFDAAQKKLQETVRYVVRTTEVDSLTSERHKPPPPNMPMAAVPQCRKNVPEDAIEFWNEDMPFLGLTMLEIAIKGWPDEKAVGEVRDYAFNKLREAARKEAEALPPHARKRYKEIWENEAVVQKLKQELTWGNYYRYMAVHILGELRFKEAADYLALVFGDEKEDRCLRTHAARALSKIADSKHLALLAEHLFLKDLPQEAQREVKFDAFDAGQVVRVLKELLPRATDRERRCRIISALAERTRRGDPLTMMQARDVLQSALAVEKDPQVRLTIKNYLESLSDTAQPPAPRYERTDLAFDDCTPADDWDVMRDAAEGKADPAALQEARKRYLAAVDGVAKKYTNGNVFATKDLHSDGWPWNVDDEEARAFFKTVASLKPGMSRIDVLAKLPADLWIEPHDPDYTLGKEVVWHRIAKQFSKEVEGPFGLKRKDCEFILVFVNDRLRVVHVRH